jgi:hypothetical protein
MTDDLRVLGRFLRPGQRVIAAGRAVGRDEQDGRPHSLLIGILRASVLVREEEPDPSPTVISSASALISLVAMLSWPCAAIRCLNRSDAS